MRRFLALSLAGALMAISLPATVAAQTSSINGTAADEVKAPYSDYFVRARNVQTGEIAGTSQLDSSGHFSFSGLPPARYIVELVQSSNSKILCTEGPLNLAERNVSPDGQVTLRSVTLNNVRISCNNHKAAWWLLGAAGAAGVTAAVAAAVTASQSN